eukprot:jgi/Bigna1/82522/fgenesh1_pg.93_\
MQNMIMLLLLLLLLEADFNNDTTEVFARLKNKLGWKVEGDKKARRQGLHIDAGLGADNAEQTSHLTNEFGTLWRLSEMEIASIRGGELMVVDTVIGLIGLVVDTVIGLIGLVVEVHNVHGEVQTADSIVENLQQHVKLVATELKRIWASSTKLSIQAGKELMGKTKNTTTKSTTSKAI